MLDIKQSVHDQFGKVADNYRTSQVHAAGEDLAQIAAYVATLAEQNGLPYVLDVGCGAGHTAMTVAPHSQQVIALDLTKQMLEQVEKLAADKGLSNVQTKQGDVEQLPFDDQTFDVVVSRYSAHHWPNPSLAVQEIWRVLKLGGQFILSDVISPQAPAQDTFLQALELLRDPSHVRDHSISQWQAMLTQAGFQSKIIFEWRLKLNFQNWTARMATPAQQVAMLKTLFDLVSEDIRASFLIEATYDFTLYGAVFAAMRI